MMPSRSATQFDPDSFDLHWQNLNEDARTRLVKKAGLFEPSIGILPVIQGLSSYHYKLRTEARKSLKMILDKISRQINQAEDIVSYQQGLRDSVRVGARVFQELKPEMPFNEMSFFFNILLELGEKGAYFAFKSVLSGVVSIRDMKKILGTATSLQCLLFVSQYLKTSPAICLKYGPVFKIILEKINSRQEVILFYAGLFDRNQDADPFLSNIQPRLRDPDTLIEKEVASDSPNIRSMGLKALAMMTDKVPVEILKATLDGQDVKKLRVVVYNIVERSALGVYPAMFGPILKQLDMARGEETLHAFRALVVAGRHPVYRLMEIIKKEYPGLLPDILKEIARLSRLSFFFIQDIALNREHYIEKHLDINRACVLGMIRKRPERVAQNILGQIGPGGGTGPEIKELVDRINRLLYKEHQDIEFTAARLLQDKRFKQNDPGPRGLFKSFFKSPEKKKIEALKGNLSSDGISFMDQVVEHENLSNLTCMASKVFFTRALIRECDLSGSYFGNACFRNCFFYNVNMDEAQFDAINFDHAVLINVSAQKTVFKNCSFQGAVLFNCNFAGSRLFNAMFVEADISKTEFKQARLDFATFTRSKVSKSYFDSAYLDQTDFSGTRARFSRFPFYSQSMLCSQNVDYNARQFQLRNQDLPDISQSMVHEINQLIFCEFIHYGEMKFLKQNRLSIQTAYDIFRHGPADFFLIAPLLVHENIQFPDMPPIDPVTPCGIADYLPSTQTGLALGTYIGNRDLELKKNSNPGIQAMFTMGSVGSLAQTSDSDIDYWICIHGETMAADELALLEKKFKDIEVMARETFKVRVTFFIVDILKARNNDFGGSTQESSGSAQGRLLKEEFYRTMIHVAGKLPFWAILPTAVSLNYYNLILGKVNEFVSFPRYIDLGDIHAIPVNEYFGASIWQMFKWLKSPFKSIIKMALLDSYIAAYGKESLLCNQYKDEWMNSGIHFKLGQNDSYIILLNKLLGYFSAARDMKSFNLILTCFFLKLEIAEEKQIRLTPLGLRKILLDKCLDDWGWGRKRVFEIGRFRHWKYSWAKRLSTTLEFYMLSKYEKVKQEFKSRSQGLMISDTDRRVLERKVRIEFQDRPFKIKKNLLISRSHQHFTRLHIKYRVNEDGSKGWKLVNGGAVMDRNDPEPLLAARTIEEIGAWLINNRLYTPHAVIDLVPNPTRVTHDDIKKLYDHMVDFFRPGFELTVGFEELEKNLPQISRLFITLNFYAGKHQGSIGDYCAVYLNSWGEMFCRPHDPGRVFADLEEAKKDILFSIGLKEFPEQTVFYFSKGVFR